MPTAAASNPSSKIGNGVETDIKVPAHQALKAAHLDALKKLLESATCEPPPGYPSIVDDRHPAGRRRLPLGLMITKSSGPYHDLLQS